MTRVIKFHEYGGPEVLKVESMSQGELGPGDVRVRMTAIALNRANALFREGTYLFDASFPSRIGAEGVGIIEAIAPDVTGFEIGQRVNLLAPDNESKSGYAADINIVAKEKLLPAPDGLSDREAATAWIPFLTIYNLFHEQGQAAKGRWIVLPAASSSVSLAANSLAHHLGARTIGITRTVEKRARLEAAGYDAIIIAEDEDVTARIIEITDGGADFIFDPVGGPQLEKLAAAVKRGADINVYGILDSTGTQLPVFPLMNSGAKLSCYTVYELIADPLRLAAAVEYYLPLFKAGHIEPTADDREFTLDEIADAFRHMESNNQFGKVIVTC